MGLFKWEEKHFARIPLIIVIIVGILVFLYGGYYVIKKYQNYKLEKTEKQIVELFNKTIEGVKVKSELEMKELKNEIENLKSKTTKQTQNQQQADNKILKLKDELKSFSISSKENYDEQANVVLDSIAKVICFLEKDKIISGSVWNVNDIYYLVTNKHVLEEVDKENERCVITIARDWNAVADDSKIAYKNNNLLVYNLDTTYNYWEIDGFDFAIIKIFEYEQSISYLEEIAMVTNETECNQTLGVGSKIKIVGFPYTSAISLPTITEGIISSFENIGDTTYYITSAKIEHGNSGGIAVTDNYYCTVGIPTSVIVGDTESLGRILLLTEDMLKKYFQSINQ